MTEESTESISANENDEANQQVSGRSVFIVNTTPAGISVQTALLTDEQNLLNMPAVFPDVDYALAQIDELRRLVSQHFSEAAKLGGQMLASQQQAAKEAEENAAQEKEAAED